LIEFKSLRGLPLALAAALAWPAAAQTLYKLVDRQGRVTYSDRAPGHFEGTVTTLEADVAPDSRPAAQTGETASRREGVPGLAKERRTSRELLTRNLSDARARVEVARQAMIKGREVLPEDMQTVQHRLAPLRSGEQPPRGNCFSSTDARGGVVLNCPSVVPDAGFYERQKRLEEAVKIAEEELALAERAFRRGTD
jgi:hypothetical protein